MGAEVRNTNAMGNGTQKTNEIPNRLRKYADMLGMPHHVSVTRTKMPIGVRAAQFAPFAALTGFDASIREEARLTEAKRELDEQEKAQLDHALQMILAHQQNQPKVLLTFFRPDTRKTGGNYIRLQGHVKKVNLTERVLVLADGERIPLDEIRELYLPEYEF